MIPRRREFRPPTTPGVRNAVVVVRYGGEHPGFVLAGRSLREVEQRVSVMGTLV